MTWFIKIAQVFVVNAAALIGSTAVLADDRSAQSPGPGLSSSLAALSRLVADGGVSVRRDVAYGPDARHRLDVYEPTSRYEPRQKTGNWATNKRQPIVVFYYGGSWTSGDRSLYAFLGSALASRGYTTVVADYRLYPQVAFPAFVDDAARAYGWVDATLARGNNGVRRPVYVMGHSAGAHIGALLVLEPGYLSRYGSDIGRPAGLIGLAGPYSFDPTTWADTAAIFATVANKPDEARPVAVATRRGPVPPRALLLHGALDSVVPQSATADLATALRARGGAVSMVEYPLVGHLGIVLAYAAPLRWRARVLDRTVTFLEGANPPS